MQVSVDNIDADLFGRGVPGGSFQPSDDNMHNMRTQAIAMLQEAYDKDLVRLCSLQSGCMTATVSTHDKIMIRALGRCNTHVACAKERD